MKYLFSVMTLLAFFLIFQIDAQAQDLSLRQAVYFKFKDGRIDTKSPFAEFGDMMQISKSAAVAVKDGRYQFAVGFFLFRKNLQNDQPLNVKISVADVGNPEPTEPFVQTVTFEKGKAVAQVITKTPFLKIDQSRIEIRIDTDGKHQELNEENNSLTFSMTVTEKEIPGSVKKGYSLNLRGDFADDGKALSKNFGIELQTRRKI